ncbi:hypothetical protein [Methylocella sp.]|uniref:hypothetical protein n=1 Tax=Methylocella sp. TaxID=1978226 RepID=UPI003783A8D9
MRVLEQHVEGDVLALRLRVGRRRQAQRDRLPRAQDAARLARRRAVDEDRPSSTSAFAGVATA